MVSDGCAAGGGGVVDGTFRCSGVTVRAGAPGCGRRQTRRTYRATVHPSGREVKLPGALEPVARPRRERKAEAGQKNRPRDNAPRLFPIGARRRWTKTERVRRRRSPSLATRCLLRFAASASMKASRTNGWKRNEGLRASSLLVRSGRRSLQALKTGRWIRHAATLPLVVAGAWHGVEQGNRGAFLLAGAGALAWFVWPEASRFLVWRRRRRAEVARVRLERAMSRAAREVAKAERARERADRRPSSERRARQVEHMEKRARRAVARAARARDHGAAPPDDPGAR